MTLRTSVFKQVLRDLGHEDVQARADFIGMHRSSLVRLETGETLPGMRFLAFTLAAFRSRGLKFEDFFEVVDQGLHVHERAA